MDPDIEPNDTSIPLPRNLKVSDVIESNIVNLNIISTISRWIDKVDCNSKFSYLRELYLPYKFRLLLKGSRDGFSPRKFHELCDDKPNTVTFIKVKGTDDILDGHNPSIWKYCSNWNSSWGQSYCSFIFSFKSKDDIKDSILSRIKNIDKALHYFEYSGPSFGGSDLELSYTGNVIYAYQFNCNICKQTNYEKRIRDTEKEFCIEDYEVFQITKK